MQGQRDREDRKKARLAKKGERKRGREERERGRERIAKSPETDQVRIQKAFPPTLIAGKIIEMKCPSEAHALLD